MSCSWEGRGKEGIWEEQVTLKTSHVETYYRRSFL